MNFFKILFFLLFSTVLYATPIFVDNTQKSVGILSKSQIYIDHTRKLTIDDVSKSDIKFEKNEKALLGFGYSPNFDVWVKFTLKNTTDNTIEKILEYDNSLTTDIEFYKSLNEVVREGSFNILSDRNTLTPIFEIKLKPFEEKTFYIKTSSYVTTLIVKLNLWNIDSFYIKEMKHQAILSLFFGAMIILALYNLFVFFFTKDNSYLFYVFYISGIVLHQLVYVGMTNQIFNQSMTIYMIAGAPLLVAFPIYSLGLFTKVFLNVKQYKVHNNILSLFLILIPVLVVFFLLTDDYNKYRNIINLVFLVFLVYLTIFAAIKKNKQAYFILFGWFIIFLSIFFMILSSSGVFNIFQKFKYFVELALVLEAVIFSIALADRIKQLQKEKNEINKKLIIQEREEGRRLKIEVEKKTKDLVEALDEKGLLLRELSHRVKNNMQMIISLLRLQVDEIDDKKVEEIFLSVQNRLNAMSHLHELLYQQDSSISHVNAYEYFDKLVDDLKQSFKTENIEINLNIDTQLKIEQAIYCGLILNELITNAIKYAFEDKHGKIDVLLKKNDNEIRFNIKDNGVGFKELKDKDSLGLLLVETLSTKQLRGDINIDTSNGVEVDIRWRLDDKNKSLNS